MENLEEVLQALDEFQKMRPSEIPRELEDYLCWVAKTGDPVYQWSLIKTLFREKLTRVMTDFYESCPTLELAPCPNVEHFNYDTMKSNLLERLESFANAPFTVQRICELLTAPRKEYNRVDKFMRAIEKNILVVSTREPGPIARRSENGDGMVNGSVDADASATQPPQDVEMEYWEKDCPSTVTISVHTVENETPLLHTVIPTTVVKNVFDSEENSHEKIESTSKTEMSSSFIPTTSEFAGVTNVTAHGQVQDSPIAPTVQSISTVVPDGSGIVGDVPEAMMNEDTSSQPSLDLENEDTDTTESTRKLQTTFQAKDFTSSESKSSKFYLDNSKVNDKTEVGETQEEKVIKRNEQEKSELELKVDSKEPVGPIVENLLESSDDKIENKLNSDPEVETAKTVIESSGTVIENKENLGLENSSVESTSPTSSTDSLKLESFKSYTVEKNPTSSTEESKSNLILSTGDTICRIPQAEVRSKDTTASASSRDISLDVEDLKDQSTPAESRDDPKPIIEEPASKDSNTMENSNCSKEKDKLTITEAIEDETRVTKSIVPDPIPIVEEPKDTEPANLEVEVTSSIVELPEDSQNETSAMVCHMENEDKPMSVENDSSIEVQGNDSATGNKIKNKNSVIETSVCKRACDTVELMEVDEEETLSMFQQDEPMEQETAELSKS